MYEQTQLQSEPAAPKTSNRGLWIGVAVAVLLCCCCIIASTFVLLTLLGPSVNNVFSTINEGLLTPSAPDVEDIPSIPEVPESPDGYSDLIPQGGLGDEVLRTDTWAYVMAASAMSGCVATDASKTTIEVLQEPDSAGIWKEKWTVTCDDDTQQSFDVTFSPSAQGGTNIDVTSSK